MSGFFARVLGEGWCPPNVARVSVKSPTRAPGFGTALVVGERHAVTCLHVLQDVVGTNSGWDLTVELRLGDGVERVCARMPPVGKDETHDLALLQLEQPCASWMALPRGVPRAAVRRTVVALGTKGDLTPSSYQGDMDFFTVQRTNGRDEQRAAPFGAPNGFSGGPVFAEGDDGEALLVGLSRLGGDDVTWGKIIARDTVVDFLRRHLPTLHDADDCPAGWVGTWREAVGRLGLKPEIGKIGDADLPPFWHVEPRPGRHAYLGLLPLATRRWGQLTLADHLPDAAAVRDRLRELSAATARPLRLPTRAELQAFEGRLEGLPRYRLAGLPPDLRLFGDVAKPRLAPEGSLEWVDAGADGATSGMQLCESLGDGVVRPVTQRAGRPAVMRVAFDA